MENKNFKFSLLDYYVEKLHIAPEDVEDKVREDMDTMGISIFANYFNILPKKGKNYDCLNAGKYNEIFNISWHIEFDDFDGSIDIEPMDVDEYTVPFTAEVWELMIRGDVEIKLGITDDLGYLDTDEFDYLLQERRALHRRFYYHVAQDSISYYIDTTKSDGFISIEEATDENKKTLAFHMAEKAGYIYSTYDAAKRAASHLAYAFNRELV